MSDKKVLVAHFIHNRNRYTLISSWIYWVKMSSEQSGNGIICTYLHVEGEEEREGEEGGLRVMENDNEKKQQQWLLAISERTEE